MLGLKGLYVDKPESLAGAWAKAFMPDWPVVLEVETDPEVAPLPRHVTLAQAKAFMSSIAKGDRGAGEVLADTARQLIHGVLPD